MATRKKTKKKSSRSKKSAGKNLRAKQPPQKRRTPKAERNAVPKRAAAKKKATTKTPNVKSPSRILKKTRNEQPQPGSSAFSRKSSGLQSGDLQGLSNVESVDSESVDELMEEGNAFEAGVVSGVEDSRDRGGKEVRTREVPEDDVPGEYLDED
jgi:hypothetical protein